MRLLTAVLLASIPTIRPIQVPQTIERPKSIVKTAHLGTNAIAITCLNGADPTGTKAGNVLIISCGK